MRFAGRVFKAGKYWAIEIPILNVATQGSSKREAFFMIKDAIESLINKKGFEVDVFPGKKEYFEIGSSDWPVLAAFLLRRQRMKQGLTLKEVSKRLGTKSHNSYARYEQGKAIPSIKKFNQLLSALSPDKNFVFTEMPKI